MALSATCIAEVRNGGSDTANGGIFNPSATLATDLAATNANTSSPTVTSASYTFVAGDVGHWLFVRSGTNWLPGWYQIASVSAGAATLTAGIGTAFLYAASSGGPYSPSTVAGCATVASPTGGTWTIDYSQADTQPAALQLTGLSTSAANAIILTASATVAMIGNGIIITGGTNFTVGTYQINSVSVGVSITVDRNCTTAAGSSGTANIGGGLASPGAAAALLGSITGTKIFVKYNATPYTISSASTNVSGGCVSMGTSGRQFWISYDTNRHIFNSDANKSNLKLGSVSTATIFSGTGTSGIIANFIVDGNSQTSSTGINTAGTVINCVAQNFTTAAYTISNTNAVLIGCTATANSTAAFTVSAGTIGIVIGCEAYNNTCPGFKGFYHAMNCLAYSNSGATTDGFQGCLFITNCTAYANGRDNYRNATNSLAFYWTNCISEAATGVDFNQTSSSAALLKLTNCTSYSPSGTGRTAGNAIFDQGAITGSGSFFVNAASGNFALNNTAGAGALCRGAGYPSTLPAGTTANYLDVGAAQHQDSGGGGGGKILSSSIIEGLGTI